MQNVLVIGATSAIAQATIQRIAARGAHLFLVARDPAKLDSIADDLRVRGAPQVETVAADVLNRDQHTEIITAALDVYPQLDTVLIAHGVLPDQAACEQDAQMALETIDINFLSVVSLLTPLANFLAEQGRGNVIVISSVAGDRGRQSNYIYGAAKSGLDAYLQGLRNRLNRAGVQVLTVKPGFVDTPMTAHIEGRGVLWAQPDDIAQGIVKAIDKRRDVVYLPGFWRVIMLIIRTIPEFVFKRLRL